MLTFKTYAFATTLATVACIVHAFSTRHQFYPTVIYLTHAKPPLILLTNASFLCLLLTVKLLTKIFLCQLTREEWEEIISTSKFAITETCLALTIFREEIGTLMLTLFTLLLFIKGFHSLLLMRIDSLQQVQFTRRLTHVRLIGLLLFLLVIDFTFTMLIGLSILKSRQASVLLLFGFEFCILLLSATILAFKYLLTAIDSHYYNDSIGRVWHNKPHYVFYLDFAADLLRLCLYVLFFVLVCVYYGFPLHLIRELGLAFYATRERVRKYLSWRANMQALQQAFETVSEADLNARGDRDCIICREEMFGYDYRPDLDRERRNSTTGDMTPARIDPAGAKRLACSHMFHFHCLRSWLERSSTCPTCRQEIKPQPQPQQQQQQQQQQQPNNQQAHQNALQDQQAAAINNNNHQLPPASNQHSGAVAQPRPSFFCQLVQSVTHSRSISRSSQSTQQQQQQALNAAQPQAAFNATATSAFPPQLFASFAANPVSMPMHQPALMPPFFPPHLPNIDPSLPVPIQQAFAAHRTLLLQSIVEALQSQIKCAQLMLEHEVEQQHKRIQTQTQQNQENRESENKSDASDHNDQQTVKCETVDV